MRLHCMITFTVFYIFCSVVCVVVASVARPRLGLRRVLATSVTATFSLSIPLHPAYSIDAIDAAVKNSQITYSNNAKNMARMSQGDYSQGSRDTSTTDRALKRKAAVICKKKNLQESKPCFEKIYSDDFVYMKALVQDAEK